MSVNKEAANNQERKMFKQNRTVQPYSIPNGMAGGGGEDDS